MIIIEGTDCVGKTTLCKKLAKQTNMVYRHLTRLPDSFHRVFDYLPMFQPNYVCDRLWLSEYAYCFGRRDVDPGSFYKRILESITTLSGALTVIVYCDTDTLREKYEVNKQDQMYNFDVVAEANNYFMAEVELSETINYPIYYIDLESADAWPTDTHIEDIILQHNELQRQWKELWKSQTKKLPSLLNHLTGVLNAWKL